MEREPFLLVIGAGSAGNACARAVARAGRSVVAVERDRVGGLCLWAGCMPKKALYNAARSVRSIKRAEQWGVSCDAAVDWPTTLAWKWHAQETYAGDQEAIASDAGIEVVHGSASFTEPGIVSVDGETYRPEHVLLACGSEPIMLDIPGAALADTSREALSYQPLPGSLAIVGAGFIAMEMAGIFASFGTKVTVVMRGSQPMRVMDPECVAIAREALEELGVTFIEHADTTALSGEPGSITLEYANGEGAVQTLDVERVLFAIGRRPALADIDVEAAGLETDERGRLVVANGIRTSDPRVFVAGDASGGPMFTPVASRMGAAVAEALLSGVADPLDFTYQPMAVFTVPELATVGLSELAAQEQDLPHEVKRMTFEYVGAAIISDERRGLVKLVVDPDGRVIGAGIAGPHASDLIYPYALAVKTGASAEDVAATRAVHPAFSEAVNWVAW